MLRCSRVTLFNFIRVCFMNSLFYQEPHSRVNEEMKWKNPESKKHFVRKSFHSFDFSEFKDIFACPYTEYHGPILHSEYVFSANTKTIFSKAKCIFAVEHSKDNIFGRISRTTESMQRQSISSRCCCCCIMNSPAL